MFWRLLITLVITAVIVMVVFASFPATRQVFHIGNLPSIDIGNIGSIFPIAQEQKTGNMSFSVNVEEYSNNISADVSNVTIALITDSGSFTLRDGEITGKKAMIIGGFSGSFSLNKNNFSLAGLSTKLELTELGVSFSNMPINGSADYWSVSISQIALSNLILENSTGSVNAKGVNMRVDNARIIIKNANASIYADAALSLHGVAHSIELPDSEIEIK